MLIEYNPDDWEAIIDHRTCDFHKKHPNQRWAGCTCSSTYSMCRKRENEKVKIKEEAEVRFFGQNMRDVKRIIKDWINKPKIKYCKECGTAVGVEDDE